MTESYRTVYLPGEGEIVEKRSRFIATTAPAQSEEEALGFIEAMKKKYWNATHNCWAYVTGPDSRLARCGDDGEPQGTAGRPMLDVLAGEELYHICVVVTRYFGGTLLGAGGLIRAYSGAVRAGLANSQLIEKKLGRRIRVRCGYDMTGRIQRQIAQNGLFTLDSRYEADVQMLILAPEKDVEQAIEALTKATGAKASILTEDRTWFAVFEKKILLFDH